MTPVFVHVWEPGERIYNHGKPDPRYVADPTSTAALDEVAQITGAPRAFSGGPDAARSSRAARNAVGRAGTRTHIDAYARIALAPWFVLGGIVPLGVPALAAERLAWPPCAGRFSLPARAARRLAGCGGAAAARLRPAGRAAPPGEAEG